MYLLGVEATSDTGFSYLNRKEYVFRTKNGFEKLGNWVNYTSRWSQFGLLKEAKW